MNNFMRRKALSALGLLLAAACGTLAAQTGGKTLHLTGSEEVPAVATQAAATGTISVAPDGTVTGSITTTAIAGTVAHVHMGAVGSNGQVIIPLTKNGDSIWQVPPGTRLTSDQMAAYLAGGLYVNVHSDAHKGGEIRAQLKP